MSDRQGYNSRRSEQRAEGDRVPVDGDMKPRDHPQDVDGKHRGNALQQGRENTKKKLPAFYHHSKQDDYAKYKDHQKEIFHYYCPLGKMYVRAWGNITFRYCNRRAFLIKCV